MDENSCHIQTMFEVIYNQSHEIADDCFLNIKRDYDICLKLLWIEEKWNIVSDNFYEWEEEIKNSYDFLLDNHKDCNEEYGKKEIITLNRRLFNVLSGIRMYRDQVLNDLSNLDKDLKEKFEKETLSYDLVVHSNIRYIPLLYVTMYHSHYSFLIVKPY